jgi:uncharacterized membrane protein
LRQTEPLSPDIELRIATVGGRLAAVDVVRGIVMALMVLDHTRDFFTDARIDATDPATSTLPLFFTRWVTHFCAPMFVFLAGASAYLAGALGKRRSRNALAWFVATRGLFLMLLELTLVRLGAFFNWSLDGMFLQVIWVIGLSLVLVAALVAIGLPARWVGLLGAAIVLSHNVLDLVLGPVGMDFSGPPTIPWWYAMLLRPGRIFLADGITWFVAYPLLPWFGIMALGYAFGPVLLRDRVERVRLTAAFGLAATIAFLVLRASALYGDPQLFHVQDTPTRTLMAFLNCQKYPPSLLYALMTLGPGLLVMAALDASERAVALHGGRTSLLRQVLVTLGRVPLFYYLLQWPLIHVMTIVVNRLAGHTIAWTSGPFDTVLPGYSLPFVYLMWVVAVAILYVPCRWYAAFKLRRKDWTWLSYV